jgi:hypothetical protein
MPNDLQELNSKLRNRLLEYRVSEAGKETSVHINAIDIATSLVEYALEEKRQIFTYERNWFNAAYHIDYVLGGSEWQDLSDLYAQLCDLLESRNFQI